jgi:hypothetical protein
MYPLVGLNLIRCVFLWPDYVHGMNPKYSRCSPLLFDARQKATLQVV